MPVPCAHCGKDIDIMIVNAQADMYHYHGRCYSALLAQLQDPPENPDEDDAEAPPDPQPSDTAQPSQPQQEPAAQPRLHPNPEHP